MIKTRSRFLSYFLTLAIFMTLMSGFALNVTADSWTYPSVAPNGAFDGGIGTQDSPYQIATPQQLTDFAYLVNSGTDYDGMFFVLTADIDLDNGAWTPIGASPTVCFSGSFNGDGYKVSNLNVNAGSDYAGLFGCITGGTVSYLKADGTISAGTYDYAGGIVGYASGNSDINNCAFSGSVIGGRYVGGIVGKADDGTVEACYNKGSVTGNDNVGGIAGSSECALSNCYNTGAVSGTANYGGLLGTNSGTAEKCYSYVSDLGLTGENTGTITSCYYLSAAGNADTLTSDEFADKDSIAAHFSGWDFSENTGVWKMSESLERPVLQINAEAEIFVALTDVNKPVVSGGSGTGGIPKVGDILTASTTATPVKYQWYVNGEAVKNATAKEYTVSGDDIGCAIYVTVIQDVDENGNSLAFDVVKKSDETKAVYYEANIFKKKYLTLAAALIDAEYDDVVTLADDVTYDVVITDGMDATLDLSGKVLTGSISVESGGKLTITDSGSPKGAVTGAVASAGRLQIEEGHFLGTVSGDGVSIIGGWFTQEFGDLVNAGYVDSDGFQNDDESVSSPYKTHIAAKSVTVSFDANGGKGTMADQVVFANTSTKLNESTYTRSGYSFSGWNTKKAGTGKSYSDKAKVMLSEDITLYAQWTKRSTDTAASTSNNSGSSGGSYTAVTPASRTTVGRKYSDCLKDSTCPTAAYTDVSSSAWYHDGIHYVLDNGLMSGYGGGLFGPNDSVTRAMLVTILWNMEGQPTPDGSKSFNDVEADSWYENAVLWAADEWIVWGYENGGFGPNDNLTREQLTTIIHRYAQYKYADVSAGKDLDLTGYSDIFDASQWAIEALQWGVGSGLISGRTNVTLNPSDFATRAEIATIVMRYCTEIR